MYLLMPSRVFLQQMQTVKSLIETGSEREKINGEGWEESPFKIDR